MKILNQNDWFPGQDLNRACPEQGLCGRIAVFSKGLYVCALRIKFSDELTQKGNNPSGTRSDEQVYNQLNDHVLKKDPFEIWDHWIDSSHKTGCKANCI